MQIRNGLLGICLLLINGINLYSQENYDDEIKTYFKQVESLIKQKSHNKAIFLDQNILLIEKENSSGEEKILILLKLHEATKFKSISIACNYNNEALELSQAIGFKEGVLRARYNRAYLQFVHGNFSSCTDELKTIEPEISYEKYPENYADVKTLKSYVYTEKGQYDLALEIGFDLLDLAEKSENDYLFMRAYFSLSHFYLRAEHYSNALNYCLKSFKYILKLKTTQYIYPKIDEIARMTAKLNNPQRALEIYSFGLAIKKEIPSTGSFLQSSVYLNMANTYMQINDFDNAQLFLTKALSLNYENEYNFRIPRALTLQAELYLSLKDTTNSIQTYEQSIESALEINAYDVVKSNSLKLAILYDKYGNLNKANKYRNRYESIRDSLFSNENEQKIIILETRRKVNEVTQMKKILELENEVQQNQFNFAIAILILITLICLIVAISFLKAKRKNKLLYRRTIELAAVQSDLNTKIQSFSENKSIPKESNHNDKTSKNPSLDIETKRLILYRLNKLEQEQFYLNPECNLGDVSAQVKTNTKYLSQVINSDKKANFNNYINEQRINYLITRLLQESEFRNSKLSYIASSVGFNNINTFKTAFKKRQGILPSYFINELNKEL